MVYERTQIYVLLKTLEEVLQGDALRKNILDALVARIDCFHCFSQTTTRLKITGFWSKRSLKCSKTKFH